jgi:hypothetical protein
VRQYRRAVAMIAAGLVVLQTLLAGLATAQAAALAANPFAAVICHADLGAGSDDGTAPDTGKATPVCCVFCTAAAPVLPPDPVSAVTRCHRGYASGLTARSRIVIAIDPRAVRAGPSQAPPHSST